MSSHPLNNLIQSIHIDHSSLTSPSRFILVSTVSGGSWGVELFGEEGESTEVYAWRSDTPLDELPAEGDILAESIRGGFLHIELNGMKELADLLTLELQFHPPGEEACTIQLEQINGEIPVRTLFDATLQLLSRPAGGGDKSEIRGLRAELSQKDAEITHLHAKLHSAKATVARASGSNAKKVPISPSKKPPNASGLQPNQKRRKALVDEFAGSSDESLEED